MYCPELAAAELVDMLHALDGGSDGADGIEAFLGQRGVDPESLCRSMHGIDSPVRNQQASQAGKERVHEAPSKRSRNPAGCR